MIGTNIIVPFLNPPFLASPLLFQFLPTLSGPASLHGKFLKGLLASRYLQLAKF